jgi:hypothetical protein
MSRSQLQQYILPQDGDADWIEYPEFYPGKVLEIASRYHRFKIVDYLNFYYIYPGIFAQTKYFAAFRVRSTYNKTTTMGYANNIWIKI